MVKKDDPFVRRAAAAAFNFNLLIWILFLIGWLLVFTIVGGLFRLRQVSA
ncbi:DUF4870 domain-containing protein [Pseudonocardia sp. ICBG601]